VNIVGFGNKTIVKKTGKKLMHILEIIIKRIQRNKLNALKIGTDETQKKLKDILTLQKEKHILQNGNREILKRF